MNTLLKGLIVTLATVFGFALIAAGVSVGLAPASDTHPVKHDKVLVKREDSAPVAAVVEDDDNSPDDNGLDPRMSTRNRNQHGSGGQARAEANDDHGGLRAAGQSDDANDMATAGTNTGGVSTNTGTGGVNVGRSITSGHNANSSGELEPGDDHGHGVEPGDDNGGGSGSSGSGSSGGGGDDGIHHDLNDD